MLDEPTIHQIEELLAAFRRNGGSDAEINALAEDIIRDHRPETVKDPSEVFGNERHESIERIVHFKNDGEKPLRQAIYDLWHHWYVKYPLVFISIFLLIFITSNAPLYWTKAQPIQTVKKETVGNSSSTSNPTSAPLEPGEVIPTTPTLVVPKIDVSAPIQFINDASEAAQDAALPNGVVHYYQTANPGEVGNTFITGHSSNYWWIKGEYNYVFANLDKLAVGDQAIIYYNGNKYLYQVNNVKVVEPTDLSVLDQTIKPTLTLMTCTPAGTSWHRLIVTFDQIAPVYTSKLVQKPANNDAAQSTKSLPKTDSNPLVDWLISLFSPSS
jgi:LPXTG-site transpeptidase (sortase) family protein